MNFAVKFFVFFVLMQVAFAQGHEGEGNRHTRGSADCSEMETWDYTMGMCMPFAMKDMPMRMIMFHYNSFFTQVQEEGKRGRHAFAVPNMFMVDVGSSVGDTHYVNLDFMATFERWTFPKQGYPELLQIGEENHDHQPYLDAQHPHSSPIMGLTLSDTISLGTGKNNAKIWIAPRGQSADGPIAFMHRQTGMLNPDAPLGHHIGQDAGHISSTVIGASLHIDGATFEFSAFHGAEPEPSKVDLPTGEINSYSVRYIQEIDSHFSFMTSAAYVKKPELHDPTLDHVLRYSTSVYNDRNLNDGWVFHNSFVWGLINFYDGVAALNSFGEEFWFQKDKKNIWSRIEYLQRTGAELQIVSGNPMSPRWVTAITLGYTYDIGKWDYHEIGLGASITKDLLPSQFQKSYSGEPLSGKIFLQVGGMKMWDY